MFLTPTYSLISFIYKDSIEQKLSLMESISGIGLMGGPMVGGVAYQYLKYDMTFIMFILATALLIPLCMSMINL